MKQYYYFSHERPCVPKPRQKLFILCMSTESNCLSKFWPALLWCFVGVRGEKLDVRDASSVVDCLAGFSGSGKRDVDRNMRWSIVILYVETICMLKGFDHTQSPGLVLLLQNGRARCIYIYPSSKTRPSSLVHLTSSTPLTPDHGYLQHLPLLPESLSSRPNEDGALCQLKFSWRQLPFDRICLQAAFGRRILFRPAASSSSGSAQQAGDHALKRFAHWQKTHCSPFRSGYLHWLCY